MRQGEERAGEDAGEQEKPAHPCAIFGEDTHAAGQNARPKRECRAGEPLKGRLKAKHGGGDTISRVVIEN